MLYLMFEFSNFALQSDAIVDFENGMGLLQAS